MAIQHRRGTKGFFRPEAMVAGEWAVVVSGDLSASDGRAVYMCFEPGVVKRMATWEDLIAFLTENNPRALGALTEAVQAATTNASNAASRANSAAQRADTAAANVSEAIEDVEAATDGIQDAIAGMQQTVGDAVDAMRASAGGTINELQEMGNDFMAFDAIARQNEQDRESAERGRAAAEGLRDSAEQARASAEGLREAAEQSRASAEASRASAEGLRAQDYATIHGEAVEATDAARDAATDAGNAANRANIAAQAAEDALDNLSDAGNVSGVYLGYDERDGERYISVFYPDEEESNG